MAKRIPTYCPRCWWDIEIDGLKFEPVNVELLREENERLKVEVARLIARVKIFESEQADRQLRERSW